MTDVEPGRWFDPGFLRELIPGSMRLTLEDGEHKIQNVSIRK